MYEASYQLKNCLRADHQMVASTDYCIGIPSLPNTPSPGRNDHPVVLVGCCMPWHRLGGTKVAMGRRRRPWLRSASASGGSLVSGVLYVGLRWCNHRHRHG